MIFPLRASHRLIKPTSEAYVLGILLDRSAKDADVIEERFVFRPGILRAFGWRVVDVPVSSWLRARASVIERIERELQYSSWELADSDPMAGTSLPTHQAQPIAGSPSTNPAEPYVPLQDEAIEEEQASTDGMTEYRLVAGASNKFWRVGVIGTDLVVEFGRVGTKGQRVVKSFDDEDRARREANKLTLEKTRKGYEEAG